MEKQIHEVTSGIYSDPDGSHLYLQVSLTSYGKKFRTVGLKCETLLNLFQKIKERDKAVPWQRNVFQTKYGNVSLASYCEIENRNGRFIWNFNFVLMDDK